MLLFLSLFVLLNIKQKNKIVDESFFNLFKCTLCKVNNANIDTITASMSQLLWYLKC